MGHLSHVLLCVNGRCDDAHLLAIRRVSEVAFLNSRGLRSAAFATISLILVGCVNEPGFPGRDDEFSRLRGQAGPFNVVSVNHERAVVSARGRQVAIEAAEGFCLAKESIETSGRSAFAMIADCVLDDPQSSKRAAAAALPQGVPGIITVSISGDQGYTRDGDGAGTLSDLSKFLETSEGRTMLGRGGAGQSVSIKESRTIDNGLYVLVEDKNTDLIPILAPRFWRSFVDLNDRLTVVTISGFKDKPLGSDEMLKYLVNQVKTLAYANRAPLNEARTYVARADTSRQDTPQNAVVALADIQPEPLTVTAETVREDVYSPVPRGRPELEVAEEEQSAEEGEVVEAPESADPSIAVEIAAATETIPVPTPRGGAESAAPAAGQTETTETVPDAKPVATEETEVAEAPNTAPEAASTPSAVPIEAEAASEDTQDETAASQADVVANVGADAGGTEAPGIVEPERPGNKAPTPVEQPVAKPDEETVATTDQTVEPDTDTAPTANAPENAPEAPKRPQRG